VTTIVLEIARIDDQVEISIANAAILLTTRPFLLVNEDDSSIPHHRTQQPKMTRFIALSRPLAAAARVQVARSAIATRSAVQSKELSYTEGIKKLGNKIRPPKRKNGSA
jgi:hypothetical protein